MVDQLARLHRSDARVVRWVRKDLGGQSRVEASPASEDLTDSVNSMAGN